MVTIDEKIEIWKNKLLDLGKRNRLLNYREVKRSSLRIEKPSIFELWKRFVVEEKPLQFPYYDDDEDNQLQLLQDSESASNEFSVVTNQPVAEQQKTLRNLREKAKTAMEERGVNILYLSFGFLKWYESEHSNQYLLSPIVLVPVTLTLESITSPFVLKLHDDDITVNPTLAYKLSVDFGIDLPDFTPDEDLESYLNSIGALVKKNKWDIVYSASLSLLSFLKINMYRDLELNRDKIKSHPVVRALAGDVSAVENNCQDIENYDHDANTKPVDLFQVVDADSSQQDAILMAKRGVSFVLQGPPGTGKSQTITNIIAECLASGKKVLFVSEKMAALEVVRKRLTDAGLGDFCLTLHSYKANKREILDQLSKVLELSKRKAKLSDEVFQKLDLLQEYKEKLNDYAEQVYEKVDPLGKSIYQVNGILANLECYENVVFDIADIVSVTPQQFNHYINLLKQFSDTVEKMSEDFRQNPWYGAGISAVTNELIHDIGAYLPNLLNKLKKTLGILDKIVKELALEHDTSYNGIFEMCEILSTASKSPGAPVNWVIKDDLAPLWNEIDRYNMLQNNFVNKQKELTAKYRELAVHDPRIILLMPEELLSSVQIESQIEALEKAISEDYCYAFWHRGEYEKAKVLYNEACRKVNEIIGIRTHLLSKFEKEIFEIDYKQILSRFKTEYTSIFKVFNSQYRIDKKTIKGLHRQVVKRVSFKEIFDVLTELRTLEEAKVWLNENAPVLSKYFGNYFAGEETDFNEIFRLLKAYEYIIQCKDLLSELFEIAREIENADIELKEQFYYLYTGLSTDWSGVLHSLNWAKDFRNICEKYNLSECFIEYVCTDTEKIDDCRMFLSDLKNAVNDLNKEFEWYLGLFENKDLIKSIPLVTLYERINKCLNNLILLEEWVDFRNIREKCISEGLGDYIQKIEQLNIKAVDIIPVFKKRFYRLWLDQILPQYPAVLNFRRRVQERTISEFADLDRLQFEIAKARIKKKLIDDLPSFDRVTSGVDELNILKRELRKQRNIMPIRKLFRTIPELLLTLKPCLMMSPLSVSLFLESGSYVFDTVIFDEASQICTENAIGAIFRGKQVIIAGDSKQLPPTNFFNATTSNEGFDSNDEDEYDDSNAYESLLDEAALLPERTLLWHYRSRHEHLIAFSNVKFYKNSLITFPANINRIPDYGVEYIYVPDGFYDRGGKKGNVIEARRVAELAFEHFKKFPDRSLGIIAFGEVQQHAIDAVIRKMRIERPQFEKFFNEDREEPFFVKNLENVQGDERDTIIFSIGYAKDVAGKFTMNFGPLSKTGGERRLNVAITRAKYNVKLVGSILPTDIDTDRISAEGPKLLRAYIDYAINGPSVILNEVKESESVEYDSPFEEAVYNFLDRNGYKVSTQVGCSGYRIDLAVKHPHISGRYVIGIECDGASYHSARTARERDRLRQAVLESMGWKIYRIWSTDWIKDPVTEGQKLIEAVESAINEYSETADGYQQNCLQKAENNFINFERKDNENDINPYGFEHERNTIFDNISRNEYGYLNLCDCIKAVVYNEFPVHYELLCRKVAPLFGNEKVTVKIHREVDYALQSINGIIRKGDFLYPAGNVKITPKVIGNTRPINYISPDEIAEAMFIIVTKSFGITKESLFQTTAREYGFNRSGERIHTALQQAYELLLESGRVRESDGKVVKNLLDVAIPYV